MSSYAQYKDLGNTSSSSSIKKSEKRPQIKDTNSFKNKMQSMMQKPVTNNPNPMAAPGYPQPTMAVSPGYPQPTMTAAPGYPQPTMAMPGNPQPTMAAAPGYPQPTMAAAPGYPQPTMAAGYAQPIMTMPGNPPSMNTGSYKIKDVNDKQGLLSSTELVIVYIWGTFCGPCKTIAPQYEELANKYNIPGKIRLAKEDVSLGLTPNIRGVPTFMFIKQGNVIDQIVGADMISLTNKIQQYSS